MDTNVTQALLESKIRLQFTVVDFECYKTLLKPAYQHSWLNNFSEKNHHRAYDTQLLRDEVIKFMVDEKMLKHDKTGRQKLLDTILQQCVKLLDVFEEKVNNEVILINKSITIDDMENHLSDRQEFLSSLKSENKNLESEILDLQQKLAKQTAKNKTIDDQNHNLEVTIEKEANEARQIQTKLAGIQENSKKLRSVMEKYV